MARGDDDLPRGNPYLPPGCSQRDIDDPDPIECDAFGEDEDDEDDEDEETMSTVYIAGPMRGYENFNFPAFDAAAEKFRGLGYQVINPADIDRKHDAATVTTDEQATANSKVYAKRDTEALLTCTHIAMLPGWEKSTGATAEFHFAKWIGLTILDARSGTPLGAQSTNPKDKIGRTKPPLDLIPPTAEVLEAMVFGLGATKYGPYNWRDNTVAARVYIGAMKRHVAAWLDGQDNDEESGVSHLAHARACLGIILDAQENGMLADDRPKKGVVAALIKRLTNFTNN